MPLRFVVSEMSAYVGMSLARQGLLVDELITERKEPGAAKVVDGSRACRWRTGLAKAWAQLPLNLDDQLLR